LKLLVHRLVILQLRRLKLPPDPVHLLSRSVKLKPLSLGFRSVVTNFWHAGLTVQA
jgi:hypothetical protein